jgi:hypothetical protein
VSQSDSDDGASTAHQGKKEPKSHIEYPKSGPHDFPPFFFGENLATQILR